MDVAVPLDYTYLLEELEYIHLSQVMTKLNTHGDTFRFMPVFPSVGKTQ